MSKLSNTLLMLELLQNGRKYSVKELSGKLEVTPRMIRAYKDELEMAGIFIETIRGPYGGYYLNQNIKLPETKDYLIVEDSPKDSYWGWGSDRLGENNLGKLWMELREEYNYINKKYKDKRRYYYGDKGNKIK